MKRQTGVRITTALGGIFSGTQYRWMILLNLNPVLTLLCALFIGVLVGVIIGLLFHASWPLEERENE